VEILGVVENMSYFIGDDGKEYDIFGRGGAEMMAQRLNIPYLGAIPINMALRANADAGNPSANFDPISAGGDQIPRALDQVIDNLEKQMALASMRIGQSKPTLNIS
jgi:ATP-binding protein involved in chromosome partitioning